MAVRPYFTAAVLFTLAGCGGESQAPQEVRLLAPAGVVEHVTRFERETGCRVDLRVYDEAEDIEAIARRRDADVIARPVLPGDSPHVSDELVRITIARGLEITIPKRLASAFKGPARPAGRRTLAWSIRDEGDNDACARRWFAYATSQ